MGKNDLSELFRQHGAEHMKEELERLISEATSKAASTNGKHPPDADLNGQRNGKVEAPSGASTRERLRYDGSAWVPCVSACSQKASTPYGVVYNASTQGYALVNDEDSWIVATETAVKRHLEATYGLKTKKPKSGLSQVDAALNDIVKKLFVYHVGPVPGYFTGVHWAAEPGKRMLVTSSPTIIEPKPGDFPTIHALLLGMLGHEQLEYFNAWLSIAYRSLVAGTSMPGQAVVLAGPKNCCKTFVQHNVITPLLGGREGKPYQYMAGITPFNLDLFDGEHLVISDEVAHTDLASRRDFGSRLKDVVANPTQRLHAKHRNAYLLLPFWRLTISTNDEPENLKILPPIDDSIEDKLMLLKVDMPECLPTEEDERAAFLAAIKEELPAYANFLKGFEVPKHLRSGRFGVTHYHNPELLDALNALAPETELLTLIDQEMFGSDAAGDWEGTSSELFKHLTREASSVRYDARRLLPTAITCGMYLARLAKRSPSSQGRTRAHQRIKDGRNLFLIECP